MKTKSNLTNERVRSAAIAVSIIPSQSKIMHGKASKTCTKCRICKFATERERSYFRSEQSSAKGTACT